MTENNVLALNVSLGQPVIPNLSAAALRGAMKNCQRRRQKIEFTHIL